jgi:2-polyprenyl-3-methyl-5-hydroxy-6-metoxy-1,4-benzoquinol methylase
MEVLDLACGHGRIANRLAVRGCRMTGLDATPLFLDHARLDAAERGVEVDYLEGDMRSLPWTGRFDRVVNWFTAFGYFDEAGNHQVMAEVARALQPGVGSPWSSSTATGSSARCSPPSCWSATAIC